MIIYVLVGKENNECEVKKMAFMTVYHGGYISSKIDDYNSSVYYENPNYIFECYKENKIL